MAEFIYKGPAVETVAFGITFPKGEAVEASDERAIAKLTNNPCFDNAAEAVAKPGRKKSVE